MSNAISPKDIPNIKKEYFPSFVLKVWNRLIAENYKFDRSVVSLKRVEQELTDKVDGEDEFSDSWLYVKEIYEEEGWDVQYQYNSNRIHTVTFIKKKS